MPGSRDSSSCDEWDDAMRPCSPAPLSPSSQASSGGWSAAVHSLEAPAGAENAGGCGSDSDEWGAGGYEEEPSADHGPSVVEGVGVVPSLPPQPQPKKKRGRPTRAQQLLNAAAKARPEGARGVDASSSAQVVVAPAAPDAPGDVASCSIGQGIWRLVLKPPVLGRPHPLADVVAAASRNARSHESAADADASRVAHAMLGPVPGRIWSLDCLAEKLELSRRVLSSRQKTIAAAAFVACRRARWGLDTLLYAATRAVKGVAYVECARYDETPMHVRSAGQPSVSVVPVLAVSDSFDSEQALTLDSHVWAPTSGEAATTDSVGKILQSDVRRGCLVKTGRASSERLGW